MTGASQEAAGRASRMGPERQARGGGAGGPGSGGGADAAPRAAISGSTSTRPVSPLQSSGRFVFLLGLIEIPWRRALQATPLFLPGESHGQKSLVGYGP